MTGPACPCGTTHRGPRCCAECRQPLDGHGNTRYCDPCRLLVIRRRRWLADHRCRWCGTHLIRGPLRCPNGNNLDTHPKPYHDAPGLKIVSE